MMTKIWMERNLVEKKKTMSVANFDLNGNDKFIGALQVLVDLHGK